MEHVNSSHGPPQSLSGLVPSALLPERVVLDALISESAYRSKIAHHTESMDMFLLKHIRAIVMEAPKIWTTSKGAVHVVTIEHLEIGKTSTKTTGGFYTYMEPGSARNTKNPYTRSVVLDLKHEIFAHECPVKCVGWEKEDAEEVSLRMQAYDAETTHGKSSAQYKELDRRIKELVQKKADAVAAAALKKNGNVAVAPSVVPGNGGPAAPAVPPAPPPRRQRQRIAVAPPTDGGPAATDTWYKKEERLFRQVTHFQVPVLFPGTAHFVIKGTERTLLMQKRMRTNRVFVFKANRAPWTWNCEIRAYHGAKQRSTSTLHLHVQCGPHGSGVLRGAMAIPYLQCPVPIMVMCRLVGFKNAEEAATCAATGGVMSGLQPIPIGCMWDMPAVHATRQWVLALLKDDAHRHMDPITCAPLDFCAMSREQLLMWVGDNCAEKRRAPETRARFIAHLTANEFLPQMGLDSSADTTAYKGRFLAYMLWRVSHVARELEDPDDRDHAGNRQYDTAGALNATHLRQHIRNFRKRVAGDIRRQCDRHVSINLGSMYEVKRITDGYMYSLSTGNWGLQKGASTQTGVSQALSRNNPLATLSHYRRVNTPLKREGKQARPRQVHTSSFGYICPAETPEGPTCGLVEQLAQCVHVCTGHATNKLVRLVCTLLSEDMSGDPIIDAAGLFWEWDPEVPTGNMANLLPRSDPVSTAPWTSRIAVLAHTPEDMARVNTHKQELDSRAAALEPESMLRLMVNGIYLGVVTDGDRAAMVLRRARRRGIIPFDVAVEKSNRLGTLVVDGEAGGLRRPLFVLGAGGRPGLDTVNDLWQAHTRRPTEDLWQALMQAGCVEYVSKDEETELLVLDTPCGPMEGGKRLPWKPYAPIGAHTHSELHPSVIHGASASDIPLAQHNQSPRITYFAGMAKQVAANPGVDTPYTNAMRLWYPQHPLVGTWAGPVLGLDQVPSGQNVVVAIGPIGGSNQEDSVVVCADSAARGLLACTVIRNHTEDCQSGSGADAQRFERPGAGCTPCSAVHGRKVGCYDQLNDKGLVAPGTHLRGGDAFIGKTMDVNEMGCIKRETIRRDQSVLLPASDRPMAVDGVTQCVGRDDKSIVSVHMHTMRFVKAGDKLTSRHGQKGVCGGLVRSVDMPFTADGLVVDVVMNPHALPSRMTIGQQLESVLGIVCAADAQHADGTTFRGVGVEHVAQLLREHGYTDLGDQQLYNPHTGLPMPYKLFTGSVYLLRVKQMTDDKAQARARGPTNLLTQQPTEGKSKGGGLRFGEMERDCAHGHGAAEIAWDRLFHQSDYAEIPVCGLCWQVAWPRAPHEQRALVIGRNEMSGYCPHCRRAGCVSMVPMPYSTKLFLQELNALNIRTQVEFEVRGAGQVHLAAAPGVYRVAPSDENPEDVGLPVANRIRARKRGRLAPVAETFALDPAALADDVDALPVGFSTFDASIANKRQRRGGSPRSYISSGYSARSFGSKGGRGTGPRLQRSHMAAVGVRAGSARAHSVGDEASVSASTYTDVFGEDEEESGDMMTSPAQFDMCSPPPYALASPTFLACSPAYVPSPSSPPSSPVYMPSSPVYMPSSPVDGPSSTAPL